MAGQRSAHDGRGGEGIRRVRYGSLLAGVSTQAQEGTWRRVGWSCSIHVDCGGGHTPMRLSNFIELCAKIKGTRIKI